MDQAVLSVFEEGRGGWYRAASAPLVTNAEAVVRHRTRRARARGSEEEEDRESILWLTRGIGEAVNGD
eukprot:716301-Rhodomonas_salina.1